MSEKIISPSLSRRGFLKLAGASATTTSLSALGFSDAEAQVAAQVRSFKLATTTETRSICTYCSVACGIIMYSDGDVRAGQKARLVHVEGDADHPTNKGTLCPKGSALKEFVNSETRTRVPRYRAPGADHWQEVSWDFALDKIARHIKDDRDANFIEKNDAGATVNRWTSMGFLAASGGTNENGWLTYKTVRALGVLPFDNQARV